MNTHQLIFEVIVLSVWRVKQRDGKAVPASRKDVGLDNNLNDKYVTADFNIFHTRGLQLSHLFETIVSNAPEISGTILEE